MAQLSHVLWLKDSKTNPNNLTGIIMQVCVCVSTRKNINYFPSCTEKGFEVADKKLKNYKKES